MGVGEGLTQDSAGVVLKMIVGYEFEKSAAPRALPSRGHHLPASSAALRTRPGRPSLVRSPLARSPLASSERAGPGVASEIESPPRAC